eukprot:s1599_g26.t1
MGMGAGDVRCIRTGHVLGGCHSSGTGSHGFRRELDPIYAAHYISDIGTQRKNPEVKSRFNAMVTRPVTRKEMMSNPKAMEAFMEEWKGLWDQEVFDFTTTREYDDVVAEAKKKGEKVHMARVHGLIYEKNYQLKEDDPARKFKGRGVLLGDQVKDQNMEAALFQELGNSPATFDASRWADYYGCLPGHDVQMADAIQAYIQAKLSGALCGHPDAGTMWEQHCRTAVQKVGFKPIGDEWPSLYFHPDFKLLLVIYVDDLKMAGPTANLPLGWKMLRPELRLEDETPLGLYLGCRISKGEAILHDKTKVQTVTYDMETYLEMTVKKYCDAPEEEEVNESNRGSLAPQAASILMKLLYAVRICRFDLLRSISNLARKITKWTKKEDALLHHLMAYVHQSKHHMMIGWAEIVAADFAMARLGLPAITLWQQLRGTDPNFVFYDDNQTMIGVIRTGKNPTMRHLERTHGISYVSLAYEVTAKMAADIHTKSFKDSVSPQSGL